MPTKSQSKSPTKQTNTRQTKHTTTTNNVPDDQALTELRENLIKKKSMTRGRGGTGNFPNAQVNNNSEDVQRVLNEILFWRKLPRAQNDEEVAERLDFFFTQCASNQERPTVEKLCLALGYARQTVNEWKNGMHCSAFRSDIIKLAFETLAAYDASMATEGRLNPVPYIFRAKNYYGMRDQVDISAVAANPLGETIDAEEIEKKYQELP